jgi:hypothetical protein
MLRLSFCAIALSLACELSSAKGGADAVLIYSKQSGPRTAIQSWSSRLRKQGHVQYRAKVFEDLGMKSIP